MKRKSKTQKNQYKEFLKFKKNELFEKAFNATTFYIQSKEKQTNRTRQTETTHHHQHSIMSKKHD